MNIPDRIIETVSNLFSNPVYIKDTVIRARQQKKVRFRLPEGVGYLTLLMVPPIIGAVSYQINKSGFQETMKYTFAAICVLQVLIFCYRASIQASETVAGEKERRTFESLATTIMPPLEIAKGKYWSVFYPLARELTILLPVFTLIGLLSGFGIDNVLLIYLLTILDTAFFASTGLYHSTKSFNTTGARSGAIGTLVFMIIGVHFAGSIIGALLMGIIGGIAMNFAAPMGYDHGSILLMTLPNTIISSLNPLSPAWSVFFFDLIKEHTQDASPFYFFANMKLIQPLTALVFYYLIGIKLFRLSVKNIGFINPK